MNGYIFVCGNDGSGKTSTVSLLNEKFSNYISVERSSPNLSKDIKSIIEQVDKMTLKYTYEKYANLPNTVLLNGYTMPIYWFILDAPVDLIEKRIQNRTDKTIWECKKSLEYFRERFRELSAYYGFPLIDTSKFDTNGVTNEIIHLIENNKYNEINQIKTQNLTYKTISDNNIENILYKMVTDNDINKFDSNGFGLCDILDTNYINENYDLKKKMFVRWLSHGKILNLNDKIIVKRDNYYFELENKIYFKLLTEGESKQVYSIVTNNSYLNKVVVIILKSTIYSHSRQATGYIENLGEVRAMGTKIFLEMLWRNQLRHSYRSINEFGIIISDFVDTNPIEIVFKKYCEGTDKHSYYNIRYNKDVVLDNGEYKNGPYIRFDWRNPNHIVVKSQTNVTENVYYYLVEEHFGKEIFFAKFLSDVTKIKPFGDKTVSSDIIQNIINVDQCRETIIKMFCTIQSYLNKVGLEVKDGCFMLDKNGTICWSEINQDCMRIINNNNKESLDKDIWRAGGSSSKNAIVEKWKSFNGIMSEYFEKNTLLEELKDFNHYHYEKTAMQILNNRELLLNKTYKNIYQKLCSKNTHRRLILTMDLYNMQPVLVKSGKVFESHSNGDINEAFNKILLHPDILVVDLNGAIDDYSTCKTSCNRNVIKELATKYYIHSGGGLRTLEDVQDILKSSARRVVVSSNTDDQFIKQIPKERLIVELSLDENDIILTNGRKINTGIKFEEKIRSLAILGVEAISLTFHQTEGHLQGLPREQIKNIMKIIPDVIKKIIIAGGISSIDDMEFLWSFDKVIPQLGSAIWKNKISLGELYTSMAKFDSNGLLPAIIQDKYGIVKGLVYMDSEALQKTCDTKLLYRYSRQHKQIMCKGESSGNYQTVTKLSLDCDSDAILVTVDTEKPFCHTNNFSCFSNQSVIKSNINTLNQFIKSRRNMNTYSGNMQKHSGLALSKLMEEFWEIVCASDKYQISECSDFLIHFIMYINSRDVLLDDILNELNARRWNPNILKQIETKQKNDFPVVIGITSEKYYKKTDDFAKDFLGFEIVRPPGKKLKIEYNITDNEKFQQYFGNRSISLIPIRPKDMNWMIALGTIDCAISYNSVIENKPLVYKKIIEEPDNSLKLVLIKRKDENIDSDLWSHSNKAIIATESVNFVHSYLTSLNINENHFKLSHVSGTSESFLVNDTKTNYILCDAIVETGSTISENNLEIWRVVKNYGEIKIGLYSSFNFN